MSEGAAWPAVRNAVRHLKEGGAQAVKLEAATGCSPRSGR